MYQKSNRQVMSTGLHNRTLGGYTSNLEVMHTPTRSTSTGSHAASDVSVCIYQSETTTRFSPWEGVRQLEKSAFLRGRYAVRSLR